MAELDTIEVQNPGDDFTVRFNGEPYAVPAGQKKSFPKFLAFHVAKHLSDRSLGKEVAKLKKEAKDNPFNPKNAQLTVYDNPRRRIALYDILGSRELVEECVASYPFGAFIGEMADYDRHVESKAA